MAMISIPQAIEEIKAGKFLIIVDDADRENEGDLAIAADKISAKAINYMAKYGRGLICLPVTGQRLDELGIPLMVDKNTSHFSTAFTTSIEAKHRVSTGISAADRAETVKAMVDPTTTPNDIAMPGHMFPLRAKEGGVLARAGHTEAVVDLAQLAGLKPAGVICEILNEDGTMARLPQLEEFSGKMGINIVTIADLISYRFRHDKLVHAVAEANMPTRYGDFTVVAYKSDTETEEHIALIMGDVTNEEPVLVRVHSQCLTGEVFGSQRCDCGEQIDQALKKIAKVGRGVLLYMRQEGRGIGIHNKIKAYALQDQGMDTVEANIELGFAPDLRDYGIGAQILADLGIHNIQLITNNPKKVVGLESYGLKVTKIVPIRIPPNKHSARYLETKKTKMGHLLDVLDEIK
ncbi:bifunctional 3,4-dihydroxy-2-butanone-4-phosphate synthase/GTP cyclohydrolase II [Chloroflexota bacterium]